jgi:hypothetical protein
MTDKELIQALKRLEYLKTVPNNKFPSIYDRSTKEVLMVDWKDIQGNVEDSKALTNKITTDLSKVTVSGGSGTTTSGNTYFPSNWI